MDRDDFLSEAAILGQFSDPNVITIEGVVLKGLYFFYTVLHVFSLSPGFENKCILRTRTSVQ